MEYQISESGTSYHAETPRIIIQVLERARKYHTRITVDYGDVKTGESWNECFDVTGYVGRSTGPVKVPLLVHNYRSMGGGSILDHCIISIRFANKKDGGFLYNQI